MKFLDSICLPIIISLQFLGCLFLLLSMFTLGPYGGAPGQAVFFAALASYYVIGLASAAYLNTRNRRSRLIAAGWNLVLGAYLMVRETRGASLLADYGIFAAVYLAVTSMAAWNHVENGVEGV